MPQVISLISGFYWTPNPWPGGEYRGRVGRSGHSFFPADQIVDMDGDCLLEVDPPYTPWDPEKGPDYIVTVSLRRRSSEIPFVLCVVRRSHMTCEPYIEKQELAHATATS